MPDLQYKRLTYSRGRSAFAVAFQSRSSLWLGPDHLLCVETSGYAETYKRFYFRDIQAITIQESSRRNIWNAILVLPVIGCLVGLLLSLISADHPVAMIVWAIFTTLFAVPFALNNLLGATCASQLRTAVQIEDLPSLCRVRQTRKVLAKIRPLIAAAQGGELTAEDVAARMKESVQGSEFKAQSSEPAEPTRANQSNPEP